MDHTTIYPTPSSSGGTLQRFTILSFLETTFVLAPPGGVYVAPLVPGAAEGQTVYTTTATPARETPPGTISNCGFYYNTVKDDFCGKIALNFSITFDQLRNMNPQLDSDCTNLWANASYCVATVKGDTITPVPITSMPSASSSSVPSRVTVAPPTQTQPGASSACYKWYTTVDGDYCYLVYSKFGIVFEQLRQWNPYLDEACSNMWPNYTYCVEA